MKKIMALIFLSILTACGGGTTNEDSVTDPVDPNNPSDPVAKALYEEQCLSCHGASGNAPIAVNVNNHTQSSLSAYIAAEMPPRDKNACVDDCATSVSEYMLQQFSSATDNSDPEGNLAECNDTIYGPRQLNLLTRSEYQNSLEDLLGINFDATKTIPFDTMVHGYNNNSSTIVTSNYADAFLSVAQQVAEWSASQNFLGVVQCGLTQGESETLSYTQCVDHFFEDFAKRVFRRPLMSSEKSSIEGVFADDLTGTDITEGLKLGITALLTSPQFLYRSEMGVSVDEAIEQSSKAALTVDPSGQQTRVDAANFQTKTTGGKEGDSGWNIWATGQIEQSFNFADNAIVIVSMRGSIAANVWPNMTLSIDGEQIAMTDVEVIDYENFEFEVSGKTGTHDVQIGFTNDLLEGDEDRNLYVEYVTVADAIATPTNDSIGKDLATLDSDAYVLTDFELAGYLSYTFTGSTPDAELLMAAQNGELSTEAQVKSHIIRLLNTDKATEHLGNFASQWLGTDIVLNEQKDADLFPNFTTEVREAMAGEVRALFTHVLNDETQPFSALFNSDYVFANNVLADFYGLPSVATSDFTKIPGVTGRLGITTTGAFLTAYADDIESSPIKRAVAIRERLLCQDIPSPPNNINQSRTEEEEKIKEELAGKIVSNREFVAAITGSELCASCHEEIINPLGFGLEDFNAVGLLRHQDANGLSIDSSGVLYGLNYLGDGDSAAFNGANGISTLLAENESTESCFSANAFRFALNIGHDQVDAANPDAGTLTDDEIKDYSCGVNLMTQSLAADNNSMKSLFIKLGTLDLIRYRKQRTR